MGAGLAILVNGRASGYQLEGQICSQCGGWMDYKGEKFTRTIHGLEGDTRLERAYYVCSKCEGNYQTGSILIEAMDNARALLPANAFKLGNMP